VKHSSRLVPTILIGGLVLAGGGSVLAAAGGSSSDNSSSQQQYCPPNSPGGGQPQGGPGNNCGNGQDTCPDGSPKPPGGNCGKPPETCPDGSPKPPPGDCGKHGTGVGNAPNSPAEDTPASSKPPKKSKPHAKLRVHKHPRRGCISRTFAARISVLNRAPGSRVTVLRDGHRVKTSRRSAFKVHFSVAHLSRGAHVVKIRVRGADGKVVTRTIRFRRC
jgi:hypothetical protein